jgi:hypothetical protein
MPNRYFVRGAARVLWSPRHLFRAWMARFRPEPVPRFLERLEVTRDPEWAFRGLATVRISPDCFDPVACPNDRLARQSAAQQERIIALLNSYSRRYRQRRFEERMARGWRGLRIVSEGDSWFQFPLLVEDIIDHLSPRHAILSLGQGGDTLDDVLAQRERELFPAIRDVAPHCVLLSGGGNDMVRDGGLARLVHELRDGVGPQGHLNDALEDFIADLLRRFRLLFGEIHAQWPGLPIIFHGYDRPIPADDVWLGRPLAHRGIVDGPFQRQVIGALMDRYNEALIGLARDLRETHGMAVHHVDCRGAIRDREWFDPMHPDDSGFARAAYRVERAIRTALEGARAQ